MNRYVAFLLLGLLLVGAAEWELHRNVLDPLRKLDRFWVKFCIGNAGNRVGNPSITMVRITDDYEPVPVGSAETSPSLTRLDYAAFLYAIGKLNPKAVSFMPSPRFQEESLLNTTAIFPLKDAALELPRMTLGTIVSSQGAPARRDEAVQYPGIEVKGDPSRLPVIATTSQPTDRDLLANGDPAFVAFADLETLENAQPRIQLVARQGDRVVPGFVLASVARQEGIGNSSITLDLESPKPVIRVGDRYTIPVAPDGSMVLPSHGGLSHSMYEVLSTDAEGKEKRTYHFASLKVEDVALAAEQGDTIAKTIFDEFTGKFESLSRNLILLGFDKTSERTIITGNDEWLSPLTANARAIATIQSGRHTAPWPIWLRGAVYAAIFLLGMVLLALRRKAAPLSIGATVLTLVAMVLAFRQTLTWTHPAPILGLFALLFLVGLFSGKKKDHPGYETESTAENTPTL